LSSYFDGARQTSCLTYKAVRWVVKNVPGALFIMANDKPRISTALRKFTF
jgi:hypothetical protein